MALFLAAFAIACGSSNTAALPQSDAGGGVDAGPKCAVANGAPNPRGDSAAAFDASGKLALLFGGDTGNAPCGGIPTHVHVGDTWIYDTSCSVWIPIDGSNGPSTRSRHVLVSDIAHDRAILFGGRRRDASSGPYTELNDTWAFDFKAQAWTQLMTTGTPPPARSNAAAAIDTVGNRLVVFGGNASTDGLSFAPLDDTWSLDLDSLAWSAVKTATKPPARLFHALAIDSASQTAYVVSGGDTNAFTGPFLTDIWALDLKASAWTEVLPTTPIANGRINFGMSFDSVNKRLLAFGGHDDGPVGNTNEIWSFDIGTRAWSRLPFGDKLHTPSKQTCVFAADFTTIDKASPERRSAFGFAPTANGAGFAVFFGKGDCGLIGDALKFDSAGAGWSMLSPSPVGLSCLRVQSTCNGLCG